MKPVESAKDVGKLALGLAVGAVLVIPATALVLVAKLFERPVTPEGLAAILRKCIDGADDAEEEFDIVTSKKIADPRLNEIKTDMVALANSDWAAPQTRRRFQELLSRVQAMQGHASS